MLKLLKSKRILGQASYLFAFTYALTPFVSSLSLGLFIIAAVFNLEKKPFTKSANTFVAAYGVLFLIYLVGAIFTAYTQRAIVLLVRILPIVVIPLLIVAAGVSTKINYTQLKKFFILGISTSCIISITVATFRFYFTSNLDEIFYFNFASFMHLHPSYFSLYILTALVFLYRIKDNFLSNFKIPIAILFFTALVLLQSKIGILILLVLVTIVIVNKIRVKNYRKSLGWTVVLISVIAAGLLYKGNRINELFKERDTVQLGTFEEDGLTQRIWLWKTALEQLKERPLLGFGFGSQEQMFRWKVEKEILNNGYNASYIKAAKLISKYNMHNNYMQLLYEFGLIGLLIFLAGCIYVYEKAWQYQKTEFLIIYSIFLLMICVEVMFNRQMGIYFFAYILPLLFFEPNNRNKNDSLQRKQ